MFSLYIYINLSIYLSVCVCVCVCVGWLVLVFSVCVCVLVVVFSVRVNVSVQVSVHCACSMGDIYKFKKRNKKIMEVLAVDRIAYVAVAYQGRGAVITGVKKDFTRDVPVLISAIAILTRSVANFVRTFGVVVHLCGDVVIFHVHGRQMNDRIFTVCDSIDRNVSRGKSFLKRISKCFVTHTGCFERIRLCNLPTHVI